MRRNVAFLGTAVVVVSAVVNVAHTASHAGQHLMSLPGWQLAYIAIVIYAAPVVAASLLWTRYRFAGAWLLAASMAGSFAFGLLYHFVIPGPDNVFTQPPGTWRTAFGVSAALLLPLQGAGCLVGLWAARASSRQIARRAKRSVAARRPRFESSPEQEERLMARFLQACAEGDMDGLLSLLSEDAIVYSDGGGKTQAALNPIFGVEKIARYFSGILRKAPPGFVVRRMRINGRLGLVGYFEDGSPHSVTTIDVAGDKVRAIRLVVNPEKLGGVPPLGQAEIVEGPR